jgi:hypothetical protein
MFWSRGGAALKQTPSHSHLARGPGLRQRRQVIVSDRLSADAHAPGWTSSMDTHVT